MQQLWRVEGVDAKVILWKITVLDPFFKKMFSQKRRGKFSIMDLKPFETKEGC